MRQSIRETRAFPVFSRVIAPFARRLRARAGGPRAGRTLALFLSSLASLGPGLAGCTSHRSPSASSSSSLAPPQQAERGGEPGTRIARGSLFATDVIGLPTGVAITPDAAPGARLVELDPHVAAAPALRAGGAVASALSPDGATLLVLTSGYNRFFDAAGQRVPEASSEWVFVFDVRGDAPVQRQALPVANAFGGIAWHPRGDRFFVGGGSDDVVRVFARASAAADAAWSESGGAIELGHLDDYGRGGLGIDESPFAAGVAVSASGRRLVVANHENDTLSVIDVEARAVTAEIPLFPGGGVAGGEFPAGVLVLGEGRAYVTSQRDREVVEVDLDTRRVLRRIRVGGQPTKIIADRAGARLFVANANSDSVSVIDRASGKVVTEIATTAPAGVAASAIGDLRGSNPNGLALSADEGRLFVTNGGNNTLAVIDLASARVIGLVPTGFYPTSVTLAGRGGRLVVTHAKSPTGPNAGGPWSNRARAQKTPYAPGVGNQYSLQLVRSGLLSLPMPSESDLAKLTTQSILNNRFRPEAAKPPPIFEALRGSVKHVIYVIGENRTYDQLFGDLPGTDGDPRLTLWGQAITPNHHALAQTFVALDRFFDAGGVSGDGWQWSTSGRTTDVAEKAIPVEYAGRGRHSYDWEGSNRNVNVSWPTVLERLVMSPHTPASIDLLPGSADVGAVDGPAEGGRGFLWDAAIAAGLSVRNYGAFCDDSRYSLPPDDPARVPPIADPFAQKTRVAFPTRASLHDRTDPYYRCFDMSYADTRRVAEWERELRDFVAQGNLPSLEIVRLPHDHLGNFETAEDGVSTPDTQMADNDYALGRIVEAVSRTPYWKDTVILALEDDAQNGSDHVDAHRSFALLAGGHVRRGAVVSTPYATPSALRTIELLLGMAPLGQVDAFAPAMADVLDVRVDATPFTAVVPEVLRTTSLPLPPLAAGGAPPRTSRVRPRGDAAFWAMQMHGQDFTRADALDTPRFNRALACGLLAAPGCTSEPASANESDAHATGSTARDDDD